jgi:hypothetical protein
MRKTESIADPTWNDIKDRDQRMVTLEMLLNKEKVEIYDLKTRLIKAEAILDKFGFRHCTIPSCNCNGYHLMTPPDKSYREAIKARETHGDPGPGRDPALPGPRELNRIKK